MIQNQRHLMLALAMTGIAIANSACEPADDSHARADSLETTAQEIDQPAPDIRTVNADLVVPEIDPDNQDAKPGKRLFQTLANGRHPNLQYVLYLPTDYVADGEKTYPVIVELSGNGGYKNRFGDTSHGVPEGSNLGYGMSGGKGFIWVCIPFVEVDQTTDRWETSTWWWGKAPDFDPKPTVSFCQQVVDDIAKRHAIDSERIVLTGFSRGAIACNLIGLYDDEIAKLWCGFVPYSHYDGPRDWSLPEADSKSAKQRLKRLNGRPQFICSESSSMTHNPQLKEAQEWIKATGIEGDFTFRSTGFRNHNDAWVLRPSKARTDLRTWLMRVTRKPNKANVE
ncbi:MAG: hypothetical protein AAFN77_05300 [Planctomycetota bacterium]